MKLLIRNLARTTTETDLRALFEVCGTLQSCTIVIDKETGESKGFGFVEMPKTGEAKIAVKTLNGKDVDGSNIRVKKAQMPGDEKIKPTVEKMSVKKPPQSRSAWQSKDRPTHAPKKRASNPSGAKKTAARKKAPDNIWGKK